MCLIEFSSSAFLYDDESNHSTQMQGKILVSSAGEERNLIIGEMRVFYFDVEGCIDQGYDPFEIFDNINTGILRYFEILYDPDTGFLKQEIIDLFKGEIFSSNLFVIDRIRIQSAYRGNNIGLAAIYRSIQQFGQGCGLVALTPFPLQFSSSAIDDDRDAEMNYQDFTNDKELASYKLRAYYQKLGFVQIEDSEIFILNPAFKLPDLAELGYRCPCLEMEA
jgi:hypothetical protein